MFKKKQLLEKNNVDGKFMYNINIDNYHQTKIDIFNNNEKNIIPKLEKNIERLEKKLNKTKDIEKIFEYQEEIDNNQKKINMINNERKKYYLDNCKYIFDYFENKQNIENDKNVKKDLNNFFNIKDNTNAKNEYEDNDVIKKNHNNYFKNNDFSQINFADYIFDKDICSECNKGELIQVNQDGIMICNNCYKNFKYLVDNEKPSYKEPPKEICFYAYKRINHFREILAQFQAKESTDIPDEIILRIKNQIKKERLDLSELTNKKTKEILKKLGYNKYYEHIPFIKDKLGIKPPIMSSQLEETLCNLFMNIQEPYSKYCPNNRVNFLNYYYTIYKLCELLGQTQFLPYFPMLIDREKKIEQDMIWRKICKELGWEFIPTV